MNIWQFLRLARWMKEKGYTKEQRKDVWEFHKYRAKMKA